MDHCELIINFDRVTLDIVYDIEDILEVDEKVGDKNTIKYYENVWINFTEILRIKVYRVRSIQLKYWHYCCTSGCAESGR